MRHRFPAILTMLLPLLVAACGDSSAVSYRIPKEKDAPAPTAAAQDPHAGLGLPADAAPPAGTMAGTAVTAAEGADLAWTAPARWHAGSGSAMRKGTYTIDGPAGSDAELAISAFPGDVGGEFANVNRWRGQLGLPPLAAAEFAGVVTRREHDGLPFAIVDLTGSATGNRMLAALVPFGGATWFFKLTGPDAVVAGAKSEFLAFLETVHPPAASAVNPSAPSAPPQAAASAGADMANTAVIKAEGPGLQWTAPAHWQSQPAAAMRKATYAIAGGDGSVADVSITAFPGDVGGEFANVNRWRNQIGLPPLAPSDLASAVTHREQAGLHLAIVDLAGTGPAAGHRMLGAIVPFDGATWFFKLTGPDALVAREKPAFLEFLGTIKAP